MIKQHHPRQLVGPVERSAIVSGRRSCTSPDVSAEGNLPDYVSDLVASVGNFSLVSAPMMWQGHGIGTIDVGARATAPLQ